MFYATGLPGWARAGAGPAPAPAADPPREEELESLRQQAELAARTLESIRQRIDELEGKPETPKS